MHGYDIQFQAYQDLYLLSKQSPHRRAQLFSLSPLGGHAHVWAEVSKTCLASLAAFTEQVRCCLRSRIQLPALKNSVTEHGIMQLFSGTLVLSAFKIIQG